MASDQLSTVIDERTGRSIIEVPVGKCVHIDMPNEKYHSLGNWSHSQLKYLPDDPESFEWKYILKREEFVVTRAMVCGTALHAWLLEGIHPTLVPDFYLNKSGGMKPGGWDQVAYDFPGVSVVKQDEYQGLCYARENCYADPEIKAYLETDGWCEHSLFSRDPETGLPTRVRLDKLCKFKDGLECLDLKYSGGVDDRWVENQVTKMAYYSQAGMYSEHVTLAYERPNRWVFLFVLNKPPYTPRLKQLLEPDVELGMRHTHVSLRDLKARLETNQWKGWGYGQTTPTQVSKWKWDENPEPVQVFEEFAEFSETQE